MIPETPPLCTFSLLLWNKSLKDADRRGGSTIEPCPKRDGVLLAISCLAFSQKIHHIWEDLLFAFSFNQ